MVLHGTFGTCFAECLFLVCVMCMYVCVCVQPESASRSGVVGGVRIFAG